MEPPTIPGRSVDCPRRWQAIGYAGLELAERLARAAEPGAEVDRLLAEILEYRGRRSEAVQVLPPAPPMEPAERVAWAITRAETLYWGGEDAELAFAALDAAGGHEAAEASRSWLLFFDARCSDAASVARSVLDSADAEPKPVIWAAAAANGILGRLDQVTDMHRRGAAVAALHATDVPWGAFEVDVGACLAHLACGLPSSAQSIAAAARGHLDDASRLLTEASAGFEANDTFRLAR